MSATGTNVGLRFARSQARLLRHLAERAMGKELPEAAGLFNAAAEAAAHGEPLIVHCTDPVEAIMMADGFTQYGVKRPAVEQLSGLA